MNTTYFSLDEIIKSETAKKHGINNIPSGQELENIQEILIPKLSMIREFIGKPFIVTSGYRCPDLNRVVRGSEYSKHMKGLACDITVPSMDIEEVYEKVKNSNLKSIIDQCILYKENNFIHFGFSDVNRQQFFENK